MRLKNIKGAKEKVLASPYIISDSKSYKGKYQKLFNNNNPIHIEIGMGKGKFIIENAKRYPDINFIGLEKYASVIVRAIDKLDGTSLPNLKLINEDALLINEMFDHEIDTIYLNFSDPWPKKRHADRRLSSPSFLTRYESIMKKKMHIIMKTDNRGLFEYSLMVFNNHDFRIDELSLDLYKEDLKNNIQTEYEERFSSNGDTIYMLNVVKK